MYTAANDAGCDIVAFPELCVTGYPPEDLVLKSGFVAENQQAMREIVAETQGCVAVFGFVDGTLGSLSNSAAIASNGILHGIYNKQLLPNYSVFDEERYFVPGSSFSLFTICGVPVGVTICEDIWQADGPVQKQAKAGATLNININGSPYHRGKFDERQQMVSERARTNSCAIVYVNQVCGQDELVFDGGSMVFDHRGDMLMRAEQFGESLSFIDIAVNESNVSSDVSVIEISQSTRATGAQHEGVITPNLSDMEQVFGALVLGTRDYVRKNGFTDVVIGLSGGIDSALVAAIAVEALGSQHVHGVSMPSRYSSEGSRTDAALLASSLGIEMQTISIEPAFAAYLDMTAESFAGKAADLTEENLQSRVRGTTLMALSNKFGWMVLTTGNKSELAVGYFTLYGDSVGGYAVIKDLLKTTVYELCRFVNVRAGREVIPEAVIIKPPSAELRPDQRDDQSLPPYEVLDPILELYVEQDRTAAEIIALGFDDALVRRISRLVDMNEYKRRQGPPGVRVSLKAFGKDRRLPITNAYRG
ncbi:putative glutamine-dependent NAD(+) synthetase [Actinomycetes bacterium]|jgi:NAD+ synthase (glutamine-hydrolysing)|nr:putative glutamine-dependent NAD(+) synthetase [Actinomycetes bacterium]